MPTPADPGALRALNPETVLAALGLVRHGRIYDLGVDLGLDTPRLPPDSVAPFSLSQFRTPASFAANGEMRGNSFSNEVIYGGLHQSCHIDALIHAQRHGRVYGGGEVSTLLGDFGWAQHGMETVPPIVARGVLLDLAAAAGVERLPDEACVTGDTVQRAVERQNLALRSGDAVLVRTGKIQQYATDRAGFEAGCPGLAGHAAVWLAEQGMVLFGIDATSADPLPTPDWDDTTHEALLVQRGIHIVENLYLEELARDGVTEFLFLCLPLRLKGATGSWVRPIALV
jgi:kynurenine formamidase